MASFGNYSFEYSLIAATVNTILTLIVILWALIQKKENARLEQALNHFEKDEKGKYQKEITEWVEIWEGLRKYLTRDVEMFELQRKTGIGTTTPTGWITNIEKKSLYDNADQKAKEYRDKTRLNQVLTLKQSESDNANLELIKSKESNNEKEELENLIKPLYLKFDKYPPRNGMSSSLIHQLSTPQELWNTPVSKTSVLKELLEDANSVIKIIEQHRELAHPQSPLRATIDRYLDIRRLHRKNLHEEIAPYGKNSVIRYYTDTEKELKEVDDLVKARYKELTSTVSADPILTPYIK